MRGLAVGVGAEPRRPSGRPAGHIVLRLSWLLHLSGAGFKMLARTCRSHSTVLQKEEREVGLCCPLAPLGTLPAPWLLAGAELGLSVPGLRNIRLALTAGSYQDLGNWCFSYKDGALHAHLFHLNCISLLVWRYFVEGKEGTVTQGYPMAVLQAASRTLKGEPSLPHAFGCAQAQRQTGKLGCLQLCALAGTLQSRELFVKPFPPGCVPTHSVALSA